VFVNLTTPSTEEEKQFSLTLVILFQKIKLDENISMLLKRILCVARRFGNFQLPSIIVFLNIAM